MRISDWSSDVCSSDLGYIYFGRRVGNRKRLELRKESTVFRVPKDVASRRVCDLPRNCQFFDLGDRICKRNGDAGANEAQCVDHEPGQRLFYMPGVKNQG